MERTASPAHRHHLEQMAETWEQLADARRRQVAKQAKSRDDKAPETDAPHNLFNRR